MDQVFCTLFDSNYLDKGIVLYKSMEKCLNEFKLYVFAFDEKTYEILRAENYPSMVVISLKEFETKELLNVKKERSAAEYCWTCTPWVIKHVLENYNENICTYIDADMRFYSSPQPEFDKMRQQGCSVIIVPHRFKDPEEERLSSETRGKYCVEFNTFLNNEAGKKVLNWWAERCLEWCFYAKPGTTEWYGDQKYLNEFPRKFSGVFICDHFGVGLAPWNIDQVDLYATDPIQIKVERTGEIVPVIIYHFESFTFLTKRIINTHSRKTTKRVHNAIYNVYCEEIVAVRKLLKERYGQEFTNKRRVVSKNPLMKIYQRYLSPLRHIRSLTDIFIVKEK